MNGPTTAPHTRSTPKLIAAALVGILLGLIGVVVPAGPVGAHASLLETSPAADAIVDTTPETVSLRFDEAVSVELAGITVYGPDGSRADRGATTTTDGDAVATIPIDDAGTGTYTAAWRVVSADSHVLSGTFLFHVQIRTGAADVTPTERPGLDVVGWFGRWTLLTGTIVLGGVALFRLAIAGRYRTAAAATRRVAIAAAGALLAGAAVRMLTQVAHTTGRPLLDTFGLLGDAVGETRAGRLDAVRLIAGVVAAFAVVIWRSTGAAVLALAAASAVMVVNALSGHAWTASAPWPAVVVDVVHQAAVATWIGGLTALAFSVPQLAGPVKWAARRFSTLAFGAVIAVTVTGLASTWWQTDGQPATLLESRYGLLLGIKVGLVVVMVSLGWWQRGRILAMVDQTGRLFRTARGELAVGAVVLGVTAAVVNTVPAREYADGGIFSANVSDEAGVVSVTLGPAAVGPNVVHVYFFDDVGGPRTVDVATGSVTLGDLPPRPFDLIAVTPSHYSAAAVDLPTPGRWTFTITTVSRGTPATLTFEVPIT